MEPFRGRESAYTRNQLRGPGFQRLYRGIYLDSAVQPDHRDWCRAVALLLPPGSAVGLLSAARLWEVRWLDPGPDVSVLVPSRATLRPQNHLVVRRAQLSPNDITTRFGIPLTRPVRTAFDLTRFLPPEDAVIALDAMLRQSKVSASALLAYIESHGWWPGVASARQAFALADGLAESPQETRMRLIIVGSDLPTPTAQVKIYCGRRVVARVDFAYEDHKLALEYDGDHHRDRTTFRFDMERQRELTRLGWRVLRFNADDVLRFPDRMLAEIRAALGRS